MGNNVTNRQIMYSESEQLISKEGHSAILLPLKNLTERSQRTTEVTDRSDQKYTTQNLIRAKTLILFAGGHAYLIPKIL